MKYVQIPEGVDFEQDQLEFLKVLDKSLSTAIDGTAKRGEFEALQVETRSKLEELAKSNKLEKMQEQMDAVFLKLDERNRTLKTEKQITAEERYKTNQWIKALIKRDVKRLQDIGDELDSKGSPAPWVPGQGGMPALPDGPVIMHGKPAPFDPEQGGFLVPELYMRQG